MQSFNNQKLVDLKNVNKSRFQRTHCGGSVDMAEISADDAPNIGGLTPVQQASQDVIRNSMKYYDIKGNSFKNTLVPK